MPLWLLLVAAVAATIVYAWRFLRERMRDPQAGTIFRNGDAAPVGVGASGRIVEVPIDIDQTRRSDQVNYAYLALLCGLIVALPLLGVWTFVSAGNSVPTWLALATVIAVMLAAILALNDLRYLATCRRLAKAAGQVGLRCSDDGLHCSIAAVGPAERAALVREGRSTRFLPWADVTGIATQEVLENGVATRFLTVSLRTPPTPCMIRITSLAIPQDRLLEIVREASAARRSPGAEA